jgi:hypothetical protein
MWLTLFIGHCILPFPNFLCTLLETINLYVHWKGGLEYLDLQSICKPNSMSLWIHELWIVLFPQTFGLGSGCKWAGFGPKNCAWIRPYISLGAGRVGTEKEFCCPNPNPSWDVLGSGRAASGLGQPDRFSQRKKRRISCYFFFIIKALWVWACIYI